MKITVGGSFHEPGWSKVIEIANKLRNAGHIVLAPGEEWTPINDGDDFVKFKGEENMNPVDLQKGFLDTMLKSDAYFYYDWTDLYCKFLFLESENALEIGIDRLLQRTQKLEDEER